MSIPSSPYQPPQSLNIAATPLTLLPLSFPSEPTIDLHELMSSTAMPAVTFIPPELAEHSAQQRIHHTHSDCGHYGSPPQVNRSQSLLRNFSLRSRNTLRKRQNQGRRPPLSLSAGVRKTDSTSASTTTSLLSVWKKWVKTVTALDAQDGELAVIPAQHHPMSCPQGSARKRSFFLPVGRIIAQLQIPSLASPPSDDSPSIIMPQSPLIGQDSVLLSNLCAIQDEDDNNKVNGNSNPSFTDADGLFPHMPDAGLESQTTDCELKSTDMVLPLPSPPFPSRSPPPLTPSSLDSSPSNSPPLLTPLSLNSPLSSSPLLLSPCSTIKPSPLPPSLSTDSSPSTPLPAFQPISHSPSPDVNSDLPPESIPESDSNLKPSISQRRRAKFTLGDGSDLDYDSLAVSASGPVGSPSLNVGNDESEPMVLPDDSTPPTATTLTPDDSFIHESRDQVDVTPTSSTGTETATTTNGKLTRRWTLSSALTDEGISDEGLVKELEKMRDVVEWDCTPVDKDGHDSPSSSPPPSPSNPTNPWLTTQRALLTTRELILTERHYLSSLLLLLCPDSTLTPVPEMMVSHAKELIDVSKRLLKGMEGEPSARGVAEVFAEVGGGLSEESAFVRWCGAVGGWFQDDLAAADTQAAAVGVKRKRKGWESVGGSGEYHFMIAEHESSGPGGVTFPTSTAASGGGGGGEHTHTSPLKRTVSTWRKSMPSVTGLGEGGVWRRDKDKDRAVDKDKDEGSSSSTCGGRGRIVFDEVRSSSSRSMSMSLTGKPLRKPAVRDLAILPTQRVTRYVLLYRDLLAYTPPSCSTYPIVERAVEAACRIAEKCNRAQSNPAFVAGGATTRDSSSSSGSSSSMLNNNNNSGSGSGSSRRRLFSGRRVTTVPEPINLKSNKSGNYGSTSTTTRQSSSTTSSPTKSHFILSSSPVSTSTSSLIPPTPSSVSRPASPTKINRSAINPLVPPPIPPIPPPSSFTNSKIPVASSRQSPSSSTLAGSFTTAPSTFSSSTSSSSSSSSSSFSPLSTPPPPLFLPKPKPKSSNNNTSSSSPPNVSSSRVPKPLSFMSMSLVNGLGRSVSRPATAVADDDGGTTSAPTKGYASAIPTKIKV